MLRNGYFGTERISRKAIVSFADRNGSERNGCKVWDGTERFSWNRTVVESQKLLNQSDYTVWARKGWNGTERNDYIRNGIYYCGTERNGPERHIPVIDNRQQAIVNRQ